MSTSCGNAALPNAVRRDERQSPLTAATTTIAAVVLFGSRLGFLVVAFDWSMAGILRVGPAVYLPLGAVTAGLTGWATIWIGRRNWRFERDAAA